MLYFKYEEYATGKQFSMRIDPDFSMSIYSSIDDYSLENDLGPWDLDFSSGIQLLLCHWSWSDLVQPNSYTLLCITDFSKEKEKLLSLAKGEELILSISADEYIGRRAP